MKETRPDLFERMSVDLASEIAWREKELREQTRLRQLCEERIEKLRAEKEEAWSFYHRVQADRHALLCMKVKEGMGASEWQLKAAKAEERARALQCQLDALTEARMSEWKELHQ